VRALARQAKMAGYKSGNRITWAQARDIAIATLNDLRESNAQTISLAIRELS